MTKRKSASAIVLHYALKLRELGDDLKQFGLASIDIRASRDQLIELLAEDIHDQEALHQLRLTHDVHEEGLVMLRQVLDITKVYTDNIAHDEELQLDKLTKEMFSSLLLANDKIHEVIDAHVQLLNAETLFLANPSDERFHTLLNEIQRCDAKEEKTRKKIKKEINKAGREVIHLTHTREVPADVKRELLEVSRAPYIASEAGQLIVMGSHAGAIGTVIGAMVRGDLLDNYLVYMLAGALWIIMQMLGGIVGGMGKGKLAVAEIKARKKLLEK